MTARPHLTGSRHPHRGALHDQEISYDADASPTARSALAAYRWHWPRVERAQRPGSHGANAGRTSMVARFRRGGRLPRVRFLAEVEAGPAVASAGEGVVCGTSATP